MTEYNWKDFLTQWRKEQFEVDARFAYFYGDMPNKFPDYYRTDYDGASEAEITQAEARLGKRLPPSYRQFLSYTNGWGKFSMSSTGFLSIDQIDWCLNKKSEMLENWGREIEYLRPSTLISTDEGGVVYGQVQRLAPSRKEQFSNTLVIVQHNLYNREKLYLLNPETINSQGEWEAWSLDTLELFVTKYPSFWEMMQAIYKEFHERASVLFLIPQYILDSKTGQQIPVYPWKEFISKWSRVLLEPGVREHIFPDDEELPLAFLESQYIGYAPATENELLKAEIRLEIKLPPSYRQFLQVTNGLPLYHTNFLLELWKLEEVDWAIKKRFGDVIEFIVREVEKGNWQLFDLPDAEYFNYSKLKGNEYRLEHLKLVLEIGGFDGNDYYLLNPLVVNQDGEWEAWTWYKEGGLERYPSFWEMMQETYYRTFILDM